MLRVVRLGNRQLHQPVAGSERSTACRLGGCVTAVAVGLTGMGASIAFPVLVLAITVAVFVSPIPVAIAVCLGRRMTAISVSVCRQRRRTVLDELLRLITRQLKLFAAQAYLALNANCAAGMPDLLCALQCLRPDGHLNHAAQKFQADDDESLSVAPGPLCYGVHDADDAYRLPLHLLAELVQRHD